MADPVDWMFPFDYNPTTGGWYRDIGDPLQPGYEHLNMADPTQRAAYNKWFAAGMPGTPGTPFSKGWKIDVGGTPEPIKTQWGTYQSFVPTGSAATMIIGSDDWLKAYDDQYTKWWNTPQAGWTADQWKQLQQSMEPYPVLSGMPFQKPIAAPTGPLPGTPAPAPAPTGITSPVAQMPQSMMMGSMPQIGGGGGGAAPTNPFAPGGYGSAITSGTKSDSSSLASLYKLAYGR